MIRISIDYSDIPETYREEVKYLVECCGRQGLIASPQEVYSAWSNYSESMAAGWLGISYPGEHGELYLSQKDCDEQNVEIIELYANKNF